MTMKGVSDRPITDDERRMRLLAAAAMITTGKTLEEIARGSDA